MEARIRTHPINLTKTTIHRIGKETKEFNSDESNNSDSRIKHLNNGSSSPTSPSPPKKLRKSHSQNKKADDAIEKAIKLLKEAAPDQLNKFLEIKKKN
jgi:hypothetical protein